MSQDPSWKTLHDPKVLDDLRVQFIEKIAKSYGLMKNPDLYYNTTCSLAIYSHSRQTIRPQCQSQWKINKYEHNIDRPTRVPRLLAKSVDEEVKLENKTIESGKQTSESGELEIEIPDSEEKQENESKKPIGTKPKITKPESHHPETQPIPADIDHEVHKYAKKHKLLKDLVHKLQRDGVKLSPDLKQKITDRFEEFSD